MTENPEDVIRVQINKDAPVICAECLSVEIRGKDLWCTKMDRQIYGSKPKWCPYPLWKEMRE